MDKTYLFVYGTLMRRCNHPKHALLLPHTTYDGEAWIQARLYMIGQYPGAVLSDNSNDKVYGERYLINNPIVFDKLDDYEACSTAFPEPHEYVRKRIATFDDNYSETIAYAYLYNWPFKEANRMISGYYDVVR